MPDEYVRLSQRWILRSKNSYQQLEIIYKWYWSKIDQIVNLTICEKAIRTIQWQRQAGQGTQLLTTRNTNLVVWGIGSVETKKKIREPSVGARLGAWLSLLIFTTKGIVNNSFWSGKRRRVLTLWYLIRHGASTNYLESVCCCKRVCHSLVEDSWEYYTRKYHSAWYWL